MPYKEKDAQCVSKKLHIGNDFVTIVYDDSKHGYNFGTIKVKRSSNIIFYTILCDTLAVFKIEIIF